MMQQYLVIQIDHLEFITGFPGKAIMGSINTQTTSYQTSTLSKNPSAESTSAKYIRLP